MKSITHHAANIPGNVTVQNDREFKTLTLNINQLRIH